MDSIKTAIDDFQFPCWGLQPEAVDHWKLCDPYVSA